MKKYIFILLLAAFTTLLHAQTSGTCAETNTSREFKYGVLDTLGKTRIPFIYDNLLYSDDVLIAQKGNKMGIVDAANKTILSFQYECVGKFYDDFSVVRQNGKYGAVDKKGKIVLACEHYAVEIINGKPVAFTKEEIEARKGRRIDIRGNSSSNELPETIRIIKSGKYRGVVEVATGDTIIPCIYTYISKPFKNRDLLEVSIDYKASGLLDMKGNVVIPCEYFQLYSFSDDYGLIFVSKDKKKGIYDTSGKLLIPLEYDDFSNSLCASGCVIAKKDKKYGVIDFSNNVLLDFEYDKLEKANFLENQFNLIATKEGKCAIITPDGKRLTPYIYNSISWAYPTPYKQIEKNGKYGIINTIDGKERIPCKYDEINSFQNPKLFICKLKKK